MDAVLIGIPGDPGSPKPVYDNCPGIASITVGRAELEGSVVTMDESESVIADIGIAAKGIPVNTELGIGQFFNLDDLVTI